MGCASKQPCSAVGCVMVWYCGHVVGLLVRWGEAPPECLDKRHDDGDDDDDGHGRTADLALLRFALHVSLPRHHLGERINA